MRKYLTVLKNSIQEAITYRGPMLVWVLHSVVWVTVMPFIWLTIYGSQSSIGGYDRQSIVGYFYFMTLIESITTSHAYESVQEDIKEGSIAQFLIKPLSYGLFGWWNQIGWSAPRTITVVIMMIIAYPLVAPYLGTISLQTNTWLILPVFIVASLIGYLCAFLIGLVCFWTTEGGWLKHFWWMTTTFAAGSVAPISFYPSFIQTLISYTPLPLLIQTPIAILLNTMPRAQIIHEIIIGALWVLILLLLTTIIWKRGVRRVDSVGL